jgi:hypothetical protein
MGEDGAGDGMFGVGDTGDGQGEGDGGSGDTGDDFKLGEWATGLTDTNKNLATKHKWVDQNAAFDSYVELRSNMDGIDRFKIPANADDAAGWDAAMKKLGTPDTADEYEFGKREEGQSDLSPEFRAWAKERRLTQNQAAGILGDVHAHQDEQAQIKEDKFITQRLKSQDDLRKVWGEDANVNFDLAKATAKEVFEFSEEMVLAMEREAGTQKVIEAFWRVGKDRGSHENAGRGGKSAGGEMSRSQAEARQAEIMASPEEQKRFADGDPAITAEFNKCSRIIHGSNPLGLYDGVT